MVLSSKSFCGCCIQFRDVADKDMGEEEYEKKIMEKNEKNHEKDDDEDRFEILMDCIFSGRC